MNKIKSSIINKINKNNGYITIDQFIETAMYDKNCGYYIKRNPIGKNGDFITAPEISQIFGELIGLYIFDYWKNYINKSFNLIELGPGKGTLLKDLLRISSNFVDYTNQINLKLIEKNLFLTKFQKKILKNESLNLESVTWKKNINNIGNKKSIFLANEIFDCFPIKQIFKTRKDYFEIIVKYNSKTNSFFLDKTKATCSKKILYEIDNIYKKNSFKDGSIIEISSALNNYVEKISKILLRNNGLLILIDYGNNKPTGQSTIRSLFKHKHTKIFDNPGNQDLTFMIDFSYLIKKFSKKKLNVYGPFSQRDFLISLGIKKRKNQILKNASIDQKLSIETEVDRLINIKQMGKLFKVLLVSSPRMKNYE